MFDEKLIQPGGEGKTRTDARSLSRLLAEPGARRPLLIDTGRPRSLDGWAKPSVRPVLVYLPWPAKDTTPPADPDLVDEILQELGIAPPPSPNSPRPGRPEPERGGRRPGWARCENAAVTLRRYWPHGRHSRRSGRVVRLVAGLGEFGGHLALPAGQVVQHLLELAWSRPTTPGKQVGALAGVTGQGAVPSAGQILTGRPSARRVAGPGRVQFQISSSRSSLFCSADAPRAAPRGRDEVDGRAHGCSAPAAHSRACWPPG